MPTIEGKIVRLACNQVSTEGVLDSLSGAPVVLSQGATAKIQCGLFSDEPSSTTKVDDLSDLQGVTLYVRKSSPTGTLLLTIGDGGFDDAATYVEWVAGGYDFQFLLSAVDTNQAVPSSGTLPIYFAIVITTSSSSYLAAFGYGQIQDVGIVDVGDPTDPTYLNVSVDGGGNVNPAVTFNFASTLLHAASPTFTGVPVAPTAALNTSTTQLATTAFVQAQLVPSSWVGPTLLNSWVNYGGSYQTAAYRKDSSGRVWLRGLIKNGTNSVDTSLFLLPSGFRPTASTHFLVYGAVSNAVIEVTAAGDVNLDVPPGANTFLSLSGISFSTT